MCIRDRIKAQFWFLIFWKQIFCNPIRWALKSNNKRNQNVFSQIQKKYQSYANMSTHKTKKRKSKRNKTKQTNEAKEKKNTRLRRVGCHNPTIHLLSGRGGTQSRWAKTKQIRKIDVVQKKTRNKTKTKRILKQNITAVYLKITEKKKTLNVPSQGENKTRAADLWFVIYVACRVLSAVRCRLRRTRGWP